VALAFLTLESHSFIPDDKSSVVDVVFLCKYKAGEAKALGPNEVASVEWLSLDSVINNPKTPAWTLKSLKLANKLRINI